MAFVINRNLIKSGDKEATFFYKIFIRLCYNVSVKLVVNFISSNILGDFSGWFEMRKLKTIFLLLSLVCFPYFDAVYASSVIVYTLGIPTIANDELADFWLTGPRGSSKGVITELGIGDVNGIAEAGTLPGENAHVYVMPRRLQKNGVMLCVTQIQASTDHGDKWSNRAEKTAGFTLYETDNKTCKWFCVDGYYGDGCSKTYTDAPPVCDMTDYSKDLYGELKVRSTGGKSGMATGFVYKYLKDSYAEVTDGKNDKWGRMTGWMVPFVLVSTPDEPHGVQIENLSLLEMAAFQGSNRYDRVSGYQNRNNVLSLLTFYP